MKTIKDFFSINKMFFMLMILMINVVSFSQNFTKIQDIELKPDATLLKSFSNPINIAYTLLTAVQVLVTVVIVVTIIWQLLSFISGSNVDLGKLLMFVIGGIVIVFLVWFAPYLFMRQANDKESKGSVIKVERIVNVDKPLTFEK